MHVRASVDASRSGDRRRYSLPIPPDQDLFIASLAEAGNPSMNTLQQVLSNDAQAARRSFMVSALALTGLVSGGVAGAERWPSRPITVVSTGPAGSGPDTRARELFTHIGMS